MWVRVAACHASEPLLVSSWTPVTLKSPDPAYERALCAWRNSTLGTITLPNRRAKALDCTRFALASLRALLVPDPERVDIRPLVGAFGATSAESMEPRPRLNACPTRATIDEAAAQSLRISGSTIKDWRERIARERLVSGKVRYSPAWSTARSS